MKVSSSIKNSGGGEEECEAHIYLERLYQIRHYHWNKAKTEQNIVTITHSRRHS